MSKTNDGKDRRPTFAASVVWSASYTLAKTLERNGASLHPVSIGKWRTTIHRFLALSTQWMSSPSKK